MKPEKQYCKCGEPMSGCTITIGGATHGAFLCWRCLSGQMPAPSRIDQLLAEAVADVRRNRERRGKEAKA